MTAALGPPSGPVLRQGGLHYPFLQQYTGPGVGLKIRCWRQGGPHQALPLQCRRPFFDPCLGGPKVSLYGIRQSHFLPFRVKNRAALVRELKAVRRTPAWQLELCLSRERCPESWEEQQSG